MAKGRYDNKGPISAFAEAAKRSFNPEGSGYDYESAKAAGLGPDETGHWPSRNPRTGQILKGKAHATFHKTEASEKKAGFTIKKGENGRYYSFKDGLDTLPTNEHSGYKKDRKRRMKAKADASKRAKRLQPLMDKGGY